MAFMQRGRNEKINLSVFFCSQIQARTPHTQGGQMETESGAEKANRGGAYTENGDLHLSQVHLVSWLGHRVFRGRKGEKERGVGCVISL